ncbi:MAG TPA: FAD-binding oxidoreductase [Rhodanobacter sp.]|nr:FAD-binding oxidoreductase [Rhodanobacter sp.]
MAESFQLRLADSRMLAPSVRHLAFERADGTPLVFKPGQFLQVHFKYPDGAPAKRSYSIATVGDGNSPIARVELVVSYVTGGAATKLFADLEAGDVIDASGPNGRFCLLPNDVQPRYLLIATGTGIAPYRAMLPQLDRVLADGAREVVLLYGARNEAELLYADEFEAFAQTHPGFRFHACLSRAPRAVPRASDHRGHVQDLLADLAPRAERDIAYLCGNPAMVDATYAALREYGLPIGQIRREKYVSSR